MFDKSKYPLQAKLNRRGFVKGATAVAGGLLACNVNLSTASADALTKEQRDKMTPDDIIAAMKKGNERFRKGEIRAKLPS